MIEYRFRVPSVAIFTLYSYSKALEYPLEYLTAGSLMDLYIHPLKGILHPSHHKIYSFPASIHPLYHPLSTVRPTCHFI
jgi:hypothetical protein